MTAENRVMRKTKHFPFYIQVEVSLNIFLHLLRYHGDRHHINRPWQQGVGQGLHL